MIYFINIKTLIILYSVKIRKNKYRRYFLSFFVYENGKSNQKLYQVFKALWLYSEVHICLIFSDLFIYYCLLLSLSEHFSTRQKHNLDIYRLLEI
jgi:hypothetical protein